MEKIIDFSSFFEENTIDRKLQHIQNQLVKGNLSKNKLFDIANELNFLFDYVDKKLLREAYMSDLSFQNTSKTKQLIGSLLNTCYHKWVDKNIDMLTEQALQIAQKDQNLSQKNTSRKIAKLEKKLNQISFENALSLENRHLVHVAKSSLKKPDPNKLSKNAKTLRLDFSSSSEFNNIIDNYDVCLSLYEISGDLFHNNFDTAFEKFYSLPKSLQDDMTKHLEKRKASMTNIKFVEDFNEWQKNLFLIIQSFVGLANQILVGSNECIYPSKEEIIDLFNDSFFHQKENLADF